MRIPGGSPLETQAGWYDMLSARVRRFSRRTNALPQAGVGRVARAAQILADTDRDDLHEERVQLGRDRDVPGGHRLIVSHGRSSLSIFGHPI